MDKMGGTCSMRAGDRKYKILIGRKPEGERTMGKLDVNRRVILKRILQETVCLRIGFSGGLL